MALIIGSPYPDYLPGTSNDDTIYGRGGGDDIFGRGGADLIFGDAGNDYIEGDDGNDEIYGGTGHDTIYGEAGNDYLSGQDGFDFLSGGSGRDVLIGGAGEDDLFGGSDADRLSGGGGRDILGGGSGADRLSGGDDHDVLDPGNDLNPDILNGGSGIDLADYSDANGAVLVYLDANKSGKAAAGDTYFNVEDVQGSSFNDFLQPAEFGFAFGGAGDDQLYGTLQGSVLAGDAGTDRLDMTLGATSAWLQRNSGADIIDGFIESESQDRFYISLSEFNLGPTFGEEDLTNSNTVSAIGTNAQIIYEGDAERVWWDANGALAGGLQLLATLVNSTIGNNDIGLNDFIAVA